MNDTQTYEEIEEFVLNYVDNCSKAGIIKLYEQITGKKAILDGDTRE